MHHEPLDGVEDARVADRATVFVACFADASENAKEVQPYHWFVGV